MKPETFSSILPALLLTVGVAAQDPALTDVTPQDPAQKERPYALMVGDSAPPLAIQEWVKGEPLGSLTDGNVHVVEFWATWCGPCIHGMPHLSELQKKYQEQGVRIVGVNIWDDPKNVAPFLEKEIAMHDGKTGDEIMAYTVAIEEKDDPNDVRTGRMAKEWMAAAGRNGIPSAFLVDGKGRVAWIGHPAGLDQPLAKLVAGEWDVDAEAKKYAALLAEQKRLETYFDLFENKKYSEAYALGRELMKGAVWENASTLNQLAWGIVDPAAKPQQQDLELALKAAQRAAELTQHENPAILDTLAVAYFQSGDVAKAIEIQRTAVARADAGLAGELRDRLQEFERAAAAAEASGKKKQGDTDR